MLLATLYGLAQLLALITLTILPLPIWLAGLGVLGCALHAGWVVPRHITCRHPQAFRGLRRDDSGWQLWSEANGWQAVQLRRDSVALPLVVLLHVRVPGERWARGLCIPCDALPREAHRRLRVRLQFSRRRWAAPE